MGRQQLARLAQPFPDRLVQRDPKGNAYVAHHDVTQYLLGIVGPFDFERVEIIRGDVPEIRPNPNGRSDRARSGAPALHGVVVAAIYRLTVELDGRRTTVEEIGECGDPHNWPHDGARLKDAASDAIKRCSMRLGLGLHLWCGDNYILAGRLRSELARSDGGQPEVASPSNAPEAGEASPSPASGSNGQRAAGVGR